MRFGLLAGTALVAVTFAVAMAPQLAVAQQGGRGGDAEGSFRPGGAGGAEGVAGGNGEIEFLGGSGGGGGGAGAPGGLGGGLSGGAGGAGGAVSNISSGGVHQVTGAVGGKARDGEEGVDGVDGMFDGGGAGGGGAGANGLNVSAPGVNVTSGGSITGGAGGAGGEGGFGGFIAGQGGGGGDGGNGLRITSKGASTITNAGSIIGGRGGSGGEGGFTSLEGQEASGGNGLGGAGVIGSNLTIVNTGLIEGGLSGDETNRANSITFNGGQNNLDISTGTLTGDIAINAGVLNFNQQKAATLKNNVVGAGDVTFGGKGTLTVNGGLSYKGSTGVFGSVLAGADNVFSSGSKTTVSTGGTLDLGGFQQTIDTLGITGGKLVNGSIVSTGLTSTGGFISNVTGGSDISFLSGKTDVSGANAFGKLVNTGTINITSGTLSASSIDNNAGTINVGAKATLEGTGNTLNNGATINVAANASVIDAGDINNLAAGVINFNGPGGLSTLESGSGVITNAGKINVVSGDLDITGFVTNSGSGLLSLGAGAGTVTAGLVINQGSAQIDVKGGTLDTLLLTNLSTNAAGVNIGANGKLNATAVVNKGGSTIVNAGVLSSDVPVLNAGVITNSGTLNGGVINTSKVNNTGKINGGVTNTGGTVTTSGLITGGLINAGTTNASGKITGDIKNVLFVGVLNTTGNLVATGKLDNQLGAKLNVTGGSITGITTLTNSGAVTIAAARTLSAGTITNNKGGVISVGAGGSLRGTSNTLNNNGTINVAAGAWVYDAGAVNNNASGVINFNGATGKALLASDTKLITNAGKINVNAAGAVQVNGTLTNSASGSLNLTAAAGKVGVIGQLNNNDSATISVLGGQLTVGGTLTNASKAATGVNIAAKAGINALNITNKAGSTIVNSGTLASNSKIQNSGSIQNKAGGVVNGGVINTAFVNNAGTINGGVDNAAGAAVTTTGVINQGVTNAGTVLASGAVNGPIVNNKAGSFIVTGALTSNGAFTNNGTAQLLVTGGDYKGVTTLTNNSTAATGVLVDTGKSLSASVVNAAGATIVNSGTLTSSAPISNKGTITNPGTINGGVANLAGGVLGTFGVINGGVTNAGTVNARGSVNGAIVNDNVFNVISTLASNSTFANNADGKLNVTGGDYTGLTTLTNSGTVTIAASKTLSAGTITNKGGTISVGEKATLKGTGNTLNNGATIDVATDGSVLDAGAINNLAAGVINFNGPGGLATLKSDTNIISNAGKINVLSGDLDVTGDVANSGAGLFNVATTGTVVVTGTVTNTGASQLDVQAGKLTVTGALTNKSTNAAGVNIAVGAQVGAATVSNAAGATIVNKGTLTSGAPIANSGTINTNTATSKIIGGLTNSATGVVNAAGVVNGVIVNSNLFTVTGNLTGNNTFTNQGAGKLQVTGGDFTGITTLTSLGGSVNVAAGKTLSATTAINNDVGVFTSLGTVTAPTITNGGTMNLEGVLNASTSFTNSNIANLTGDLGGNLPTISNSGTFNLNNFTLNNGVGMFTNTGLVTAFGAANTISGDVTNNNRITLQNGVTTDALVIGGKLAGAGTLAVDANLAAPAGAGRGDLVTVNGASSGTVNVGINATASGAALTTPIDVYKAAGGGAPTVTVNGASRANPFLSSGLVNYFLNESAPASGVFQIQSSVNTAPAMGIASSLSGAIGSLQSGFHQPVSAIVSRPENCSANQTIGGMFIRVNAGSTDTSLKGGASAPGLGAASSTTNSSSSFGGFQTGFDMGKCNVGNSGWDLHFGVMTGLVGVGMRSLTSVTNTLGPPGTASTSADVSAPFVGAYAFARNSGVTLEANVRRDFYRAEISSTSSGVNFVPRGTILSGAGTSVNLQASYRMMLTDRVFIEPQAGYSYGMSSFGVVGMFNGAGGAQVGAIDFSDAKTSLGRVGLLAGTTVQLTDTLYVAPFVHAIVWREFADPTTATTTLVPSGQKFVATTERVGTFGQIGGGMQFRLLESPFSGFVRGDVRFGEKIDGLAFNVGMRGNFSTH